MSENGDPGSATVNPRYIHLFVYMKTHYKMVDDKRGGEKDMQQACRSKVSVLSFTAGKQFLYLFVFV